MAGMNNMGFILPTNSTHIFPWTSLTGHNSCRGFPMDDRGITTISIFALHAKHILQEVQKHKSPSQFEFPHSILPSLEEDNDFCTLWLVTDLKEGYIKKTDIHTDIFMMSLIYATTQGYTHCFSRTD
ncbi:uncharacterized protein LOC131062629 [Cryptomeria japonica]|uniref:uncharacterized protein LOC131062629 n=1 Tax=Cryptomeria japonica TaxID=3369 RepID=UPI0025AC7336|nr:uncharacterized protein LOC131062629 [Cryptomeria japonica]